MFTKDTNITRWKIFGGHVGKKTDYKLRNPFSSGCKMARVSLPYQIWDIQP
jgi:hypothetical protein